MSRPIVTLVALSLSAIGCSPFAGEPLFALNARVGALENGTEAVVPSNLHAAILWRNGCNGCSVATPPDLTTDEIIESVTGETAARLALQPVEIVGDFPSDFTIAFVEEPPAAVLDLNFGYLTGVLVLSTFDEPRTHTRDPRFLEIGFTYPLLFPEDAEALGIVAMSPLYVSYVRDEGAVMDINMSETSQIDGADVEPPLSPGYHVARHNGVAVNASVRRYVCEHSLGGSVRAQMDSCSFASDGGLTEWEDARACEEAIVTEHCGTLPDVYGSIEVLESNASVSLTIDGNEDLLQAFDGLTLDDLLALE